MAESRSQRSAEALIRLQIELEYALDADGFLVPFPGTMERARFIAHRHASGQVRFYRQDLPLSVREQLADVPAAEAFDHAEKIKAILGAHAPCPSTFFGTSGVFADSPERAEFPDVVREGEQFLVLVEGEEASVAWSVRENVASAELAVETPPRFRRRGYGRQVAAAWAHHVIGRGKVAFYSYERTNFASKALARSLGVVEFSNIAAYD